jgi:hypothetical protein
MDLFAIDDSEQRRPTRDGMGPLVAVGGLHVPGEQVRGLELSLDALCREFGFPPGEEFKWSPSKGTWERQNLLAERRDEFNLRALALANDAGARGIVTMADTNASIAVEGAKTHEEDVTLMFLERAQACLPGGRDAIIVFDRPGGDRRKETDFLAATLSAVRAGTSYTALDRLALAVSTDSKLSRLVQLADVVTACSTSFVAGEPRYSPKIFNDGVLPLLREDYGVVGGRGLKIHPDFRYGNLYHWLLGDEHFVRYQMGFPLPDTSRFTAYRESPDVA